MSLRSPAMSCLPLVLLLAFTSASAQPFPASDSFIAPGFIRVNNQQDYERAQRHYQQERRYEQQQYQHQQEQRVHDERLLQERQYEERLQRGY